MEKIKPGLEWREEGWDWKPLSPLTKNRLTRMALVVSLVVLLVSLWFLSFWGIAVGLRLDYSHGGLPARRPLQRGTRAARSAWLIEVGS